MNKKIANLILRDIRNGVQDTYYVYHKGKIIRKVDRRRKGK